MGVNQRSQITMTDEEIVAFIEEHRTATMATTRHPLARSTLASTSVGWCIPR